MAELFLDLDVRDVGLEARIRGLMVVAGMMRLRMGITRLVGVGGTREVG